MSALPSEITTVFRCPCGIYIPSPDGIDGHLSLCFKLQEEAMIAAEHGRLENSLVDDTNVELGTLVNFYSPSVVLERLTESTLHSYYRQTQQNSEASTLDSCDAHEDHIKTEGSSCQVEDPVLVCEADLSATPPPRRCSMLALQKLRKALPALNTEDEKTDFSENEDKDYDHTLESQPKRRRRPRIQPSTSTGLADNQFIHRCSVCPTRFKSDKDFEWHMYNIHGEGSKQFEILTCPLCQRMLNKRLVFHSHLRSHENAEAIEEAFDLWNKWPPRKRIQGKVSTMKFSCKYCLISHSSQHSFLTHMEVEHNGKGRFCNYLCPYCGTSEFDTMKSFLVHFRTTHKEEYYGKTLKWSLSNPLKQQGRPKGECKVCKKMIDVYYLRDHMQKVHSTTTEGQERIEMIRKASNKMFSCPMENCFSNFKSPALLKNHFILHLQNNPFQCTFPGCYVKCDAQCHLDRHMKLHTTVPLTCPKCKNSYSRKDKLNNHVCVYDPSKLRYDENGQVRHVNSVLRLKRYHIPDENVTQNANNASIRNQDNSDGTKQMSSQSLPDKKTCRKRFNINSIMLSDPVFLHVCQKNPGFKDLIFTKGTYEHGNNRSLQIFRCIQCKTRFRERKALKKHRLRCAQTVESDSRDNVTDDGTPIGCVICGASLASANLLEEHIKSEHGSEKIFRCLTCSVIFSSRKALGRHKEYHHTKSSETYECPQCEKILSSSSSLARHMVLIHGIRSKSMASSRRPTKKKIKPLPKRKQKRKCASTLKKRNSQKNNTANTSCCASDYSIVKIEVEPEVIINDCDANTNVLSNLPLEEETLIKTEPLDYPPEETI